MNPLFFRIFNIIIFYFYIFLITNINGYLSQSSLFYFNFLKPHFLAPESERKTSKSYLAAPYLSIQSLLIEMSLQWLFAMQSSLVNCPPPLYNLSLFPKGFFLSIGISGPLLKVELRLVQPNQQGYHTQTKPASTHQNFPTFSSFFYLQNRNEYIQEQPTTNMGGSILLLSIFLELSQVSFVFSKIQRVIPLTLDS